MAQIFKINGVTYSYITKGDWSDTADNQALDGNTPVRRWRKHTLKADIMPMSEFNTLHALEGQRVSITTPAYSDRNGDYVTYCGSMLTKITAQHQSINAANVTIDLLVKV